MRSILVRAALALALVSAPLAVTGAASGIAPTSAAQAKAASTPAAAVPYVLEHGVTKATYSYKNAIRESVWVQAPDLDGDGKADLITADIVRPRELDGKTKVPVIMDASPYYLCCGRGNESETKSYDGKGNPLKMPLFYDNYFEPRGYAMVEVDMAGTARSSGCADEGAKSDIYSIKAVIDWLNGRAKAVDIKGKPVKAYWTNGDVGMIGKSYDGTLANGVAATGVEGLKTIVPISAISSWYDYDRSQGIPYSYNYPSGLSRLVEQDRTRQVDCSAINSRMDQEDADETGAYTKFWSKRDYREDPPPEASKVTASVFVLHGLQDTNVKTVNFGRWWDLMKKQDIVTKMWLSRLGHVDPFDYRRAKWVHTLHRWFDNQLMGIKNGILAQPSVDVEVSPGKWQTSNTWPVSDNDQKMTFHSDGSLTTGNADNGTDKFVNNPNQSESQAVAKGNNPNRLLYVTGNLKDDVRLSGEPTVKLSITPKNVSVGQVSVFLVDYGNEVRVPDGEGNQTLGDETCWGESTSYDDACYRRSIERTATTPLQVMARGWARLKGDKTNTLTVEMAYDDVVIPAGHQIGLAIFGASPDWLVTLDNGSTDYTVDLAKSSLTLPIVGNLNLAGNAGDLSQVPTARAVAAALGTPMDPRSRLPY
jgi:X-Pro dipeptidyl-peptidase